MASTKLRDKFGRLIYPGNVVVYPVRRGSSIFLNHATVSGADAGVLLGTTDMGVKVRIQVVERCAIVEK